MSSVEFGKKCALCIKNVITKDRFNFLECESIFTRLAILP